MHIIIFVLFGVFVGVMVRIVIPGRKPGGWAVSMLLGAGGALFGGFLGRIADLYREGQPAGFVMSLLASVALVAVYQTTASGRRISRG